MIDYDGRGTYEVVQRMSAMGRAKGVHSLIPKTSANINVDRRACHF